MAGGEKDASLHFKEAFERLYKRSPLPRILLDHFEDASQNGTNKKSKIPQTSFISPLARPLIQTSNHQQIFSSLQHPKRHQSNTPYVSDSEQSSTGDDTKQPDFSCQQQASAVDRSALGCPQIVFDENHSIRRPYRKEFTNKNNSFVQINRSLSQPMRPDMSPVICTKSVFSANTAINQGPEKYSTSKESTSPANIFNKLRYQGGNGKNNKITASSQNELRELVANTIDRLVWSSDEENEPSVASSVVQNVNCHRDLSNVVPSTSGHLLLYSAQEDSENADHLVHNETKTQPYSKKSNTYQDSETELNPQSTAVVSDEYRTLNKCPSDPEAKWSNEIPDNETDSDSVVMRRRSLRSQKLAIHLRHPLITETDDDEPCNNDNPQNEKNIEEQDDIGEACHQNRRDITLKEKNGKDVIHLYNWIIKSVPWLRGICVEGKKNLDDTDPWHSGEIVKRLDKRTVETKSGSLYRLVDDIDIDDALEGGFSADIIKHFTEGFPENWKEVIDKFYEREDIKRSQKEDDIDEDYDSSETDTIVSNETHITAHNETEKTDNSNQTASGIEERIQKQSKNENIQTPSRRVKEYVMYEWIIKPVTQYQGVCIEGKRSEAADVNEFWHSSVIVKRIDSRTLKSSSGSIYKLVGKIDKDFTLEAGFSEKVVKAFKYGFPLHWMEIIDGHYKLQESFKQQKTKGAIKVVHPQKSKKKKKSALNDTVCTPVGQFVTMDRLRKTRSGRIVKPSLAWWAGQRMITDSKTNQVRIFHATQYAEKALAEIAEDFMQSSTKFSVYKDHLQGTLTNNKLNTSKTNSASSSKSESPKKDLSKIFQGEKGNNFNDQQNSLGSSDDEDLNPSKAITHILNTRKQKRALQANVSRTKCYSKTNGKSFCNGSSAQDVYNIDNSETDDISKRVDKRKDKKLSQIDKSDKFKRKEDEENVSPPKLRRNSHHARTSKSHNRVENEDSESQAANEDKINMRITRSKSLKNAKTNNRNKQNISSNEELDDSCPHGKYAKSPESAKQKKNNKRNNKPVNYAICSDSSDSEFSTRSDKVKKKRTKSCLTSNKCWKLRNCVEKQNCEDEQKAWTKNETTCLNEAVRTLRADDPHFWTHVAQKVKTRNESECQELYYKQLQQKDKQCKNTQKKAEAEKAPGQVSLTARVGTLKRKQQLRDLLDKHNEGYEDQLFDATPFKSRGFHKIPRMEDNEEDVLKEFGANRLDQSNIYTPLTRFYREPVSERRTPATSLVISAQDLDRKEADGYMHKLRKRRRLVIRSKENKNDVKDKMASPTYTLFKKASPADLNSLFEEGSVSSDNHQDSDNEKDYYWSDIEDK